MNRRNFISKTGFLLAGVGVAESFKMDLLDKLGRVILPQASAADAEQPKRVIEICFRAGIPLIIFGAGKEFSTANAKYENFSYGTMGNEILPADNATGANNVLYNVDSAALRPYAANVAITQGIQPFDGQHTDLFDYRRGGVAMASAKVTPIVELADKNTSNSLIHGVMFPGTGNQARNSAPGIRDLEVTNTSDQFKALYKNPTLRFAKSEVSTILGAAATLSRRQALLMEAKMNDAAGQANAHGKAAALFQNDYTKLLDSSQLGVSKLSIATSDGAMAGVTYMKTSVASILKGFQNNLVNSGMITVNLQDWHGYQADGQNGPIAKDISNILAETIKFLQATPEQDYPSLTLWDTTTIVLGSEFTRVINPFGMDNGDGSTQGIMMIGKNVKGNYYGGFNLSGGGAGTAYGFDLTSGAVNMQTRNTSEQAYHTIRQAIGLNLTTTEKERVMKVMLRA